MADIDITNTPYFDRFDPSSDYTMLLFNPDRPLQQRELNETQSLFSYYLQQLGNTSMKDGDIQSGMEYTQDGMTITVNDGDVYVAGKVRNFTKQSVAITGSGMENVGIKISQSIVTSADDASLNDPTQDVPSSGSSGANRLKETVLLVANDSTAATVYTFNNGVLYRTNANNELSRVQDIMARRTFATNGNYRIGSQGRETGFSMSLSPNASDTSKVNVVVQPGYAFVQGYEVEKLSPTLIPIDKSSTYENISDEQHVYHTGTNEYSLSMPNVRVINKVSAQVQSTFTITHKAADGADFVVDNLISIDKVYTEGTSGRVYTEGTDYRVTGNTVDWYYPTGQEPAVNSSYLVTATYNKVLTGGGVDYTANISTDVNGYSSITFAGAKGQGNTPAYVPKNGGYITIDYDAYLFRIDTVTLDKDGNFTVHSGSPARKDIVAAPELNDPFTLVIGNVTVYPHSNEGYCDNSAVTNVTFEKLQKYIVRLQNIEYNQVLTSLDNQTIQDHTPLQLRGVLTDAFVTMDKYDETYDNRSTASDGFKSNVMFSFDDGTISLPKDAEDPHQAQIIGDSSTAHVFGRLVSAPFTEVPIIQQLQATAFQTVVPYSNSKVEGVLSLTPAEDNWVDTTNLTVYNTKTYTYNTGRWWRHPGHNVSGGATHNYYNQNTDWNAASDKQIANSKSRVKTLKGVLTTSGITTTEEQIQYMRTQDISFTAKGLKPNQDNLSMRFAGILVNITPATGYHSGSTVSGSIMADSNGVASGKFTIPANTLCGKVAVELDSDASTAVTTFVAEGINKTVTDTITKTYVTAHVADPVAESFQTLDSRIITGVKLYFGSKSTTSNVKVSIRGMGSNSPSTTVYAEQTLTPAEVNVSSDASAVTEVNFDDPLMTTPGQWYSIIVGSDSSDYTVAFAQTGANLIGTTTKVIGQPYEAGVMFLSSNGIIWNAYQDRDLKFEIMGAKFSTSPSTMVFDPFLNLSLDEFVLFSTYLTPDNTGCTWEYRMMYSGDTADISTLPWLPLSSYTLTDAGGTASKVQLRATFQANEYVSPLMSLSDLAFGAFTTALRGDYVTYTVPMTDSPFNTISLDYNENLPGQSTVVPQYSVDDGKTWVNFASTPTSSPVSTEWTGIHYSESIGTTKTSFKFHFKLTTPNPYQRPRVSSLRIALTNE